MKMKSIRLGHAVATVCVVQLLAASPYAVAQGKGSYSQDTVKIGVLTDMSGIFADLGGKGSVTAAQMAIDDFREQNTPPFKIELLQANHQNKADIGASRAREWFDVENVDMITDVINSGVALAVAKVAQNKNKMVMVTGSGTARLHDEDCNPNTIHYGWDARTFANAHVRAQTEQRRKSWFFLSVDYALGRSLEQDATAAIMANGGTVAGSVRHPLSAPDFSSYMLQAQSSKAQVVGIANAGADLVNAVKAANEYGVTRTKSLAGLAATITDVHAMGIDATQGMVVVEDFYWDLNDRTRAWSRRFFDKQKRMPNFVQAATYSAVLTYLKSVLAARSDDSNVVLKQMKQLTINDVFANNGKIRDDNKMVHDVYVMEVKKPQESKAPWDYYRVRRTVAGSDASQPLSASKCPMVKKGI
ncbi:ABC transporter substrate-binding protein [Cupriavidus lacunae]|nr:ABC transporter substrate-binding protein [Cupriavidus lacunae]